MTFSDNLKKFLESLPIKPEGLENIDASLWEFCETAQKELNLKVKGKEEYYHAQEGALEEATKLWEEQALIFYDLVICYGLGLGYLVDAADSWLSALPKVRKLVIVEDDPKVLLRFLESPRAEAILKHPQVKIVCLRGDGSDDNLIFELLRSCAILPFHFRHVLFLALPYYSRVKQHDFDNLKAQMYHLKEIVERGRERGFYVQDIVYNHLRNLKFLPKSYDIVAAKDLFKGIPVIICGGGSSLEDLLPKLKEWQDRALIVGVGAGISILTQAGLRPHLCFGLDPTLRHTARVMMNSQFEVPFVYSTRMHYRGVEMIQAPLVATLGEGTEEILWIFEKLKLNLSRESQGVGVGNYACNQLQMLGCNPIMFIGVDLAHTKGKPYAEGFRQHPLAVDLLESKYSTQLEFIRDLPEDKKKELIAKEEYLQYITTSQFILEAQSYEEFARDYPETTYVNLSPIGAKIHGFLKLSFEEAEQRYLKQTLDLSSLLHGRLCQMAFQKIDREQISFYYQEWIETLDQAYQLCLKIQEAFKLDENLKEIPEDVSKMLSELMESEAYLHLMQKYDQYFLIMRNHRLEWWPAENEEIDLATEHANFLVYLSSTVLEFFKATQSEICEYQEKIFPRFPALEGVSEEKPGEGDLYSLQDGMLTIIDWDLELSYHEPFNPSEEAGAFERVEKILYPSGATEFEQHRKGEKLHGPMTYMGMNGEILAVAWYVDGQKQGKAWRYYPSGALYAVERFRNDGREGKQEFFYESGLHRTIMNFHKNLLHGDIILYHPNGQKKRFIQFKEGKRSGEEKFWDADGLLRGELRYEEDLPTGTAFSWHENGTKQLEILYWDPGKIEKLLEWDPAGNELQKQYFTNDKMMKQVDDMVGKLAGLQEQLREVAAKLPASEEFDKLKEQLEGKTEVDFETFVGEMKKLEKMFKPEEDL